MGSDYNLNVPPGGESPDVHKYKKKYVNIRTEGSSQRQSQPYGQDENDGVQIINVMSS